MSNINNNQKLIIKILLPKNKNKLAKINKLIKINKNSYSRKSFSMKKHQFKRNNNKR